MASLKQSSLQRSAQTAAKRGHQSVKNRMNPVKELEPQQLFREESDSKSDESDDFMTFDSKPVKVGGTGAKFSRRDLSTGSRKSSQTQP